jgi:anti-anti-sigma factor
MEAVQQKQPFSPGGCMRFTSQIQGHTGIVQLEGGFTFDTHPAFKACTQELLDTRGLTRLVLDMSGVDYMDASSLGVILLLREAAEEKFVAVCLQKPSPAVVDLLKVVQFEKLFPVLS